MKHKVAKEVGFLKKQKSSIHGFGVFTGKRINQGERFYNISLKKVVSTPHKRYAKIGKNRFVNDSVLNWTNHSCNPTVRLSVNTKEPHLVALRDIAKGEEITCNYNKTEVDGRKVACMCNNMDCKRYFLRVE